MSNCYSSWNIEYGSSSVYLRPLAVFKEKSWPSDECLLRSSCEKSLLKCFKQRFQSQQESFTHLYKTLCFTFPLTWIIIPMFSIFSHNILSPRFVHLLSNSYSLASLGNSINLVFIHRTLYLQFSFPPKNTRACNDQLS